jgi:N,N'-diacetyllegionaminate synthase
VAEALAAPMDKSKLRVSPDLRRIFGKSLAVNSNLPEGHRIELDDLESKKPGDSGIPASEFRSVLGRRLARPMQAWEFLNHADLTSD